MKKILFGALIAFTIWCATTEDGKIAAVKLAAWVKLNPPVLALDLDELNDGMTKNDVTEKYKKLDLYCTPDSSGMGDESCNSDVSIINNLLAHNVAFFFANGQLNAVRLAFQPQSRTALEEDLTAKYQRHHTVKNTDVNSKEDEPIAVFKAKSGFLMTSKQQSKLDEVLVLWIMRLDDPQSRRFL